ncbi:MAG TPA: hypothetical protein IAC02_03190 [Candidatus Coprovivens excrementavium]|nr:hypothetical protein [Candidatus Coprovivens excrementavium]
MREYMKENIDYVDKIIKNKDKGKIDEVITEHLLKIKFFQHERFIHLCVTLFYALITLIFLALTLLSWVFIPIVVIVVVFLILYIYHYFYLENGVQYMYKQYDELKKMTRK